MLSDKFRLFDFKSLQEDLADRSTFLWVGNTVNLKNQWKENLPEKEAEWDSVKLKQYPLVALQGSAEANFVQSRFTAQRDNPKQQKNSVKTTKTKKHNKNKKASRKTKKQKIWSLQPPLGSGGGGWRLQIFCFFVFLEAFLFFFVFTLSF